MQDPVHLEMIYCDVCGRKITPKEFCLMYTVWRHYNGAMRRSYECQDCAERRGVNAAIFECRETT